MTSAIMGAAETAAGFIPVVGPVVASALSIADALGIGDWLTRHLWGTGGDAVAQAVVQVASSVIGGAPTKQAILGLDPDKRAALELELAKIAQAREAEQDRAKEASRQADLDELRALIGDADSARKMALQAGVKSPLQWGPVVLSVIIVGAFAAIAAGLVQPAAGGLDSMMQPALMLVLYFWFGRGQRDAQMDQTLANSIPAHAIPMLQGGGASGGAPFVR